jgi:hypothetical protein
MDWRDTIVISGSPWLGVVSIASYLNVGMKVDVDEGRVYGSRYYCAKPVFDPSIQYFGHNHEWDNMIGWCVETFGATSSDGVWTPNMRWYVNNAKFWFRNDGDLNLFLLRWA